MIVAGMLLLAGPWLQEPSPEDASIRRAVRFLVETQEEDGSWRTEIGESAEPGMRIAVTALAMHALLRSPADPDAARAADRGLKFLRDHVSSVGGPFAANEQFNFNLWGIAYGLDHLHGAVEAWPGSRPEVRPVVDALISAATRAQLPCGGWSYLKKDQDGKAWTDGSVSFLTASMIEGLLRWKEAGVPVAPEVLKRAVADLERTAEPDDLPYVHYGQYGTDPGADGAGRTVQARRVLLEAGEGSPEAVGKALDAFFRRREAFEKVRNRYEHVPPDRIAGYYYYYAHHHAARALRRLGRDPADHARTLREVFAREQLDDGSWRDVAAGGKSCGTSFVLLALADLRAMRWKPGFDEACAAARAAGIPVLAFFTDGRKEAGEVEALLADPLVAKALDRVACVRIPIRKEDPLGKRAKVTSGGVLLLLDPALPDPLAKPLRKWTGRRTAKAFLADLEKALKKE